MGELVRIGDINSETAIAIPTSEGQIAMSVQDVIRWVAPGAPPNEALKFLLTCKAAEVNPFLNEAYLANFGGQWTTIISKAGWLRRAEVHPAFDGWEAGVILRTIIKQYDDRGKELPALLGPLEDHQGAVQPVGYQLVGGWAVVYRNDRKRPTVARVSLNEYRQEKAPNWKDRPCTMIRKVALVQALREAGFLTSGAYDRDEMPDLDEEAAVAQPVTARVRPNGPPAPAIPRPPIPAAIEAEYTAVPTHILPADIAMEVQTAIETVGMTKAQVNSMLVRRRVSSIIELSTGDAREILSKLYFVIDQQRAGEILLPDPAPAEEEIEVVYVDEVTGNATFTDGRVMEGDGEIVTVEVPVEAPETNGYTIPQVTRPEAAPKKRAPKKPVATA